MEHEGASLGYARSVVQAPIGAWEQAPLAGERALLGVPLACGAVLGVVVTRDNPT